MKAWQVALIIGLSFTVFAVGLYAFGYRRGYDAGYNAIHVTWHPPQFYILPPGMTLEDANKALWENRTGGNFTDGLPSANITLKAIKP